MNCAHVTYCRKESFSSIFNDSSSKLFGRVGEAVYQSMRLILMKMRWDDVSRWNFVRLLLVEKILKISQRQCKCSLYFPSAAQAQHYTLLTQKAQLTSFLLLVNTLLLWVMLGEEEVCLGLKEWMVMMMINDWIVDEVSSVAFSSHIF